jgi:hypothetical protein
MVAGAVALLALTDIWHGEQDVGLEWLLVQIAAPIILTALLSSTHFLLRVLSVASPRDGASPIASPNER